MPLLVDGLITIESIRGVLGVDEAEISDERFSEMDVDTELLAEMSTWMPAGVTYQDIVQNGRADAATDSQILQYQYLRLYAKYFCSLVIARTAPLTLAEVISDGQSEMRRPRRDMDKLLGYLSGQADKYKDLLLPLIGGTATESLALMAAAPPNYDPVTNETA